MWRGRWNRGSNVIDRVHGDDYRHHPGADAHRRGAQLSAPQVDKSWRTVGTYDTWDQADAVRLATISDTPSLDVRVRSHWGRFVVEVAR